MWYCETRFDSKNSNQKLSLSLEFTVKITPIITYVGVVFSFISILIYFDFLMILKETLTFLSLSNPVLQYRVFVFLLGQKQSNTTPISLRSLAIPGAIAILGVCDVILGVRDVILGVRVFRLTVL